MSVNFSALKYDFNEEKKSKLLKFWGQKSLDAFQSNLNKPQKLFTSYFQLSASERSLLGKITLSYIEKDEEKSRYQTLHLSEDDISVLKHMDDLFLVQLQKDRSNLSSGYDTAAPSPVTEAFFRSLQSIEKVESNAVDVEKITEKDASLFSDFVTLDVFDTKNSQSLLKNSAIHTCLLPSGAYGLYLANRLTHKSDALSESNQYSKARILLALSLHLLDGKIFTDASQKKKRFPFVVPTVLEAKEIPDSYFKLFKRKKISPFSINKKVYYILRQLQLINFLSYLQDCVYPNQGLLPEEILRLINRGLLLESKDTMDTEPFLKTLDQLLELQIIHKENNYIYFPWDVLMALPPKKENIFDLQEGRALMDSDMGITAYHQYLSTKDAYLLLTLGELQWSEHITTVKTGHHYGNFWHFLQIAPGKLTQQIKRLCANTWKVSFSDHLKQNYRESQSAYGRPIYSIQSWSPDFYHKSKLVLNEYKIPCQYPEGKKPYQIYFSDKKHYLRAIECLRQKKLIVF